MKRTPIFSLLVTLMLLVLAVVPQANAGNDDPKNDKNALTLKADTQKSTVKWLGKKVTGEHNGTISLTNGNLEIENNRLKGGAFTIDMNSIACLDLKDAEYNTKLVNHLKSDDFFSVANHPQATFKITNVKPLTKAGDNNYEITGDLAIKGITHSITFPANVKISGNKADAKATIVVDRSKYDVKYGSKSFFEGLGDKMIYDEFTLDVNLVTAADSKQAAKPAKAAK